MHGDWALPLALGSGEGGAVLADDGSIVLGGAFVGPLSLGATTLDNDAGGNQAYVAKLDASGQPIWTRAFAGAPAAVDAVGAAADGSIYLTGYFLGSLDLGTGPLAGNTFFAKLDASGATVFAKGLTAGGSGGDGLAVDASGRAVITVETGAATMYDASGEELFDIAYPGGRFTFDAAGRLLMQSVITAPFKLGGATITPLGSSSPFVAALDASGKQVWARVYGDGVALSAIAAAPGGGSVVAGSFQSTVDLGTGSVTSVGAHDLFVEWLDSTGTPTNVRTIPASIGDDVFAVAAGADGRVAITGRVSNAIDLGDGVLWPGGSLFVAVLDATGATLASARLGGPGAPYGRDIALRHDGSAIVFGQYHGGAIDLGAGPMPDGSYSRGFVASFAPSAPSATPAACPATSDAVLGDGSKLVATGTMFAADATTLAVLTSSDVTSTPRAGGATALRAMVQKQGSGLAIAGGMIHWSVLGNTASDGAVLATPVGGGPVEVIASGLAKPSALVAHAQRLYWLSETGADGGTTSTIQSLPLAGGTSPATLGTFASTASHLVVDDAAAYVTIAGATPPTVDLVRVPLGGGSPVTLTTAPRDVASLASDGAHLYFAVSASHGSDFSNSDAMVMRVPATGGPAETLAAAQGQTSSLALADGYVWWIDAGSFMNGWQHDGAIVRLAIAGASTVETVAVQTQVEPRTLLVDATGILWSDGVNVYARAKP